MGPVRAGTETQPPPEEAAGSTRAPRWRLSRRRWLEAAAWAVFAAALFTVYLRLSRTRPENSDQANILLNASDMLHGNLLLHGWYLADVSFYTTELPQYALLESLFGVHADTAHIAAAMTYTLAVLLAMLVARGGFTSRAAVIRLAHRGRDHAGPAARLRCLRPAPERRPHRDLGSRPAHLAVP